MKILCVIDCLGSGGAQRQLVGLAAAFKGQGHDVSFLTYHPLNFFKHQLDEKGILVICVDERNYIKRFFKIRRHIRHSKANVVLAFLVSPAFMSECAGFPFRKWKLIVGERSADPKILTSLTQRIIRWFHLGADYVVANSHENINMVQKAVPFLSKSKCKVIYNLIDLEKWQPDLTYEYRKNGKFTLLVAASHQYIKNLIGLVEAVNLLSEQEKEQIRIDWYGDKGDDSQAKALEKIAQYHLTGIFNFHPATSGISQKMQEADAVGLFSFYEGFPNVVCEAMSLAKPVIASAVSDVPDILGRYNFLIDPKNPQAIAGQLSKLLQTSEAELKNIGTKNREKAVTSFHQNIISNQYLELLQSK